MEKQIAAWYQAGFWTDAMVANAVAKGKISKAAYKRITGKTYPSE